MRKFLSALLQFIVLNFFISFAHATTPIEACPTGYQSATINVQLTVSTNLTGCPLLEKNKLRRRVNKHGVGNVFLYPSIAGTCVSGSNLTGTITSADGVIDIIGSSESAQRASVEAMEVNPTQGGMFLMGTSQNGAFVSGAAMTVVSLEGVNEYFKLELVLSDRFTIDLSTFPFVNTEDFLVIGAMGARVKGRLAGTALISNQIGDPIVNAPFTIDGNICIK